jgi:acetoin utilization protein AcuB
MQVRNWMTEQVEVVRPDDDVASVRARLRRLRVRQLPVVADGRLVGIITDRDVRSADDERVTVAAAMTPEPVTTMPGTPVEEAAALVRAHKIGALPVVEGGQLVGIISESDLLQALVELCSVLEPTTLIELECEEGGEALERIRRVLEKHGGRVPWMSAAPDGRGNQQVALRVQMPVGQSPEQRLEDAGFRILSSISGRAAREESPRSRGRIR